MKKRNSRIKQVLFLALAVILVSMTATISVSAEGFVQGNIIDVDGTDYYVAGPPSINDVPGHYWVVAGKNKLVGKHYNTGPKPQFWSSDAPEGELLYVVSGIIDTWTLEKAEKYASKGYVHYHELISVSDREEHPTKVLWLKHTARTSFTLDGGPLGPNPPYEHEVTPGVDYKFPVNGLTPYTP